MVLQSLSVPHLQHGKTNYTDKVIKSYGFIEEVRYKDVNKDTILDLYSISTQGLPTYDNCTHKFTYYDFDGDGFVDKEVEEVIHNHTKEEKKLIRTYKKEEQFKMDDILNPKQVDFTW